MKKQNDSNETGMVYNQVRELVVTDSEAGQRLDNLLMKQFKGVPRSRIYSMLRKGEVRINKGRVKAGYRLQGGDRVRLPPVRQRERQQADSIPDSVRSILEKAILYEDEEFLVINKPARLAVHGGSGIPFGVIEAFRIMRPNADYLELVHRLDRETSGCLMLAKSRQKLLQLHDALREGKIRKTYLALLDQHWLGGQREIKNNLEKREGKHMGRGKMRQAEQGKMAHSRFELVENFPSACLVEVRLFTGRTHQIRVHAAGLDHPILGDDKYGDFASNKLARKQGLKRLFLHAAQIQFPTEEDSLEINATMPEDLVNVLERYRK